VAAKTAAAKKKPLVSDSTIVAVARLHDDDLVDLSDEEVLERIKRQNGEAPKAAANGSGEHPPEPVPEFRWDPKGGGDPIVFPKAVTVFSKGETFRFFFKLHKLKANQYEQIIFMMEAADVPEAVQERVANLPDDEVLELISSWTGEMRTTPGES
jgi:hypothetical protein